MACMHAVINHEEENWLFDTRAHHLFSKMHPFPSGPSFKITFPEKRDEYGLGNRGASKFMKRG